MKKKIITISGLPGSGKSTAAREVAKALGYAHFSSGDVFRKMAAERGISVEEINFTAEKQKEIDLEVDKLLEQIGKEKENLVIDSRMAFHWIPSSFKVYLDLDPKAAAERMFANIQQEGRTSQSAVSVDDVYKKTQERLNSERRRYINLYKVDHTDKKNYDLVVNTATNNPQQVVMLITSAYQWWLSSPESNFSPSPKA